MPGVPSPATRKPKAPGGGAEGTGAASGMSAADRSRRRSPPQRASEAARAAGVRRRRFWARRLLVVVLVAVVWLSVSLGRALTAPGTDPLAARLAEWARFHHLGPLVTVSERVQYAMHPPKTGGLPTAPILPGRAPAAGAEPSVIGALPRPGLPALPLRAVPALAGEGQWQTLSSVGGRPAVQAAFLRPDALHTSYLAGVARLDQNLLRLAYHPGSQVPGGRGWSQPASIAPTDLDGLVATFNSGFTMQDSRGGIFSQGKTAGVLRDGAAALVIDQSGRADVVQWGRDRQLGPQVAVVRQNLDLIVDGGRLVAGLDSNDNPKWGRTIGHRTFVWRSAVGITADGSLVYVAGGALTTSSLAQLEKDAGAVRAMELDINPSWTSFMTYQHPAHGVAVPVKLTADEQPKANRYLTTSTRDFFAAYRRLP